MNNQPAFTSLRRGTILRLDSCGAQAKAGGGGGSRTRVLDTCCLSVYMFSWTIEVLRGQLLASGLGSPINLFSLTFDPVTRSLASPLVCRLPP